MSLSAPVAGLEIGTSRTVIAIGEGRDDGRLEVAALGSIPSSGVRKSQIIEMTQARYSIESVLKKLEEQSGYAIGDLRDGRYRLSDRAVASPYAASMEPSKVDIRPGQSMTIEDLLYALMMKSANDGAVVLAEHAARARAHGPATPEETPQDRVAAFVARMNRRAQELGMRDTRYASPNGLPPPRGSKRGFDVSTAYDLAKLGRALVSMPEVFTYTSRASHTVTGGGGQPISFQNHNYFVPRNRDPQHLATPIPECDGLKTGYTAASGSSIVLTAARNGRRVVVVVLGSAGRHEREAAAGRLLRDALDAVSIW